MFAVLNAASAWLTARLTAAAIADSRAVNGVSVCA
jgi:hypothetical protein